MKEKLNYIKNIIIILYILLIIFITICLLSYNDYKVSVFGNTTILPVIDDNLEPDYTVGDLLVIKKKISDVSVGDTIFFYRSTFGETVVNFAKVTNVEVVSPKESTITVEGDYMFSSQYLIGKTSAVTIIPVVGRIISILESKFGFLFLGVLPSLIIFLYTGYTLFLEVKTDDDDEDETEVEEKPKKSKKAKIEEKEPEEIVEEVVEEKQEIKEETVKEEPAKEAVESKTEEPKIEIKEEPKEEVKKEIVKEKAEQKPEPKVAETKKTMTQEEKKAMIEEKMKNMTEEQKKALIEAKLKSMTDEQKKALLEAKRKKLEENKNK